MKTKEEIEQRFLSIKDTIKISEKEAEEMSKINPIMSDIAFYERIKTLKIKLELLKWILEEI